ESVRSQVREAVGEGRTLEETRAKVDVESFRKQLTGDDMWRRRAFQSFFVKPAVGRAYKEAKGEPLDGSWIILLPPSPGPRRLPAARLLPLRARAPKSGCAGRAVPRETARGGPTDSRAEP